MSRGVARRREMTRDKAWRIAANIAKLPEKGLVGDGSYASR
jgi:hypothetical protein